MYLKTSMKSRNLTFPEKIDAGYLNFKKMLIFKKIFVRFRKILVSAENNT